MRKNDDIDKWINLLMDGKLTEEQRKKLETWLATDSEGQTLSDLRRAKILSRLLQEVGKDVPKFENPGFMWSRVQTLIAESNAQPVSWRVRLQEWFYHPAFRLGFVTLLVIGIGFSFWLFPSSKVTKMTRFGEIWKVYSYQPEVSVTAYDSKAGNATVVWVSGLEDNLFSDYGEIWRVYTYRPEVYATAYQSEKADATVIWVSGMDDVVSQ